MTWLDSLANASLKSAATSAAADGSVSYTEMLAVLNAAAPGGLTASEFTDLKSIYTNFSGTYASGYVDKISYNLIYGNPANAKWWGGTKTLAGATALGDLVAGDTQVDVGELIGKWFLGTDLPMPISGGDTATGKASTGTYNYATSTGTLFVNGVAATDINQGSLGDCYLMAALGAIANVKSSIITGMFTVNGNGTWGVQFYQNSAPVYTTVNASLAITTAGKIAFAADSTESLSGEQWVSLAEKAYTQLNTQFDVDLAGTDWKGENSYQAVEGGLAQAIKEIGNLNYKYYSSYYSSLPDSLASSFNYSTNAQTYKQTLIDALKGGAVGWLGSWGATTDADNGKRDFVAGHAYMLLGYNAATDKFIIRNPWGGDGTGTYNPQFEVSIETFWNSTVKAVVAVSDATVANPTYTYGLASNAASAAAAVTEGGDITFTVTRSASGTSSSVYVSTVNGTAIADDFAALSKQLVSFAANETVKTFAIKAYQDVLTEGTENFAVALFTSAASTTAAATTTAYIKDPAVPAAAFTYTMASSAASAGAAATEGDSPTITVTRSGTGSSSTIYLSSGNGTASAGSDFLAMSKVAVAFAANETVKTVSLTTYGDGVTEGVENFSVALYNNVGDVTAAATAGVYLKDQAPVVYDYVVTSNASTATSAASEGSSTSFTITRSSSGAPTTVYVSTLPGTAGAADYDVITMTPVTFTANQTIATVNVGISADWWLETTEWFKLGLYKNSTDTAYSAYGLAYIKDVPLDSYNYSVSSAASSAGTAVTEGSKATFTVTRSGSGSASTVYVSTASGTATDGTDYGGLNKLAVGFAAYETSKTVTVDTYQDGTVEGSEYFLLDLYRNDSDSTWSTYGTAYIKDAAVTNYDYTVASSAATSAAAVAEGGSVTFTITRAGTGSASTVYLSTASGTATNGTDYTPVDKIAVNFAGPETVKTVTVNVSQDGVTEGNEYFWLNLYKNFSDTAYSTYGVAWVKDAAAASFDYAVTSSAGTSGTAVAEGGAVTFTVTRSGTGSASTVYVDTSGGTATDGVDYASTNLQAVSFGANETVKNITVNTYQDSITEGTELFWLNLYKNATDSAWSTYGTGYIKDAALTGYNYTVTSSAQTEAGAVAEGGAATFTITRSASGSVSTVYLQSEGGSASDGVDYTQVPLQALTFSANETVKTMTVSTYTDTLVEGSEYFWLNLYTTYADALSLNWASYGSAFIKDSAASPYDYVVTSSAQSDAGAVSEGGQVTFTITRSGTGSASTIYVQSEGGSAVDGTDYASLPLQAVSFGANETVKAVTVNTYTDTLTEGSEYLWLDLYKTYGDALAYNWSSYGVAYIKDAGAAAYDYGVTSTAQTSGTAVAEGGAVTFTITRSGTGTASTVYVTSEGATATDGVDYASLPVQAISFGTNETVKTVTVNTYTDTLTEGIEYFWLDLYKTYSDVLSYNYASYGVGYVKDATVAAYDYAVTSNAQTAGTAAGEGAAVTFTITRSGSASASTVYVQTEGGSATDGVDYASKALQALSFAAGETVKTVTVNSYTDTLTEGTEYFWLDLYKTYSDAQAFNWASYGTAYLKDTAAAAYDYGVTSSAQTGASAVGEGGAVTFTITRTGSGSASSVYVQSEGGTAIDGIDYLSAPLQVVNFAAGDTVKTVTVNTYTDTLTEGNEYFWLDLYKTYGDALAYNWSSYGTAYIKDSVIANYDYTVTTGAYLNPAVEGSNVTFTVTRSGTGSATTIYVATEGSTATDGVDYASLPLQALNFAAGETVKTVTIGTYTDTLVENDEFFWLNVYKTYADALSGNYASYGTAFITDPVGFSYQVNSSAPANTSAVTEGGAVTFTIMRSGTGSASTVYVDSEGATATDGLDYASVAVRAVSFGVNDTVKTVTVNTFTDALIEGTEYFWLNLYPTYADALSFNYATYGTAYVKDPTGTGAAALAQTVSAGPIDLAAPGLLAGASDGDGALQPSASAAAPAATVPVASYPDHTLGEFKEQSAFAVVRAGGEVVAWGDAAQGGAVPGVAGQLDGTVPVVQVYSDSTAFAALRVDGSVVTWGQSLSGGDSSAVSAALNGAIDVRTVYSTTAAFAALRIDGSVVAWGNPSFGGDSSAVAAALNGNIDVTTVASNSGAFAALRTDGSVVTWGLASYGGNSSGVSAALAGGADPVMRLYSTSSAFAAIRQDGSVVTWGNSDSGGSLGSAAASLNGTTDAVNIAATTSAFAARRTDGSVVAWGNAAFGGDAFAVSSLVNGVLPVVSVYSDNGAFAALRSDGSVITWGYAAYGGNSTPVAAAINGVAHDVMTVASSKTAFAALRDDGSVVAWGDAGGGGDASAVAVKLDGTVDVTRIFSTDSAFAALRADGSVVTWGNAFAGGDSSSVSAQLNGDIDVTEVLTTGGAFAAIRTDGSVIAWGDPAQGGDAGAAAAKLLQGVAGGSTIYTDASIIDTIAPLATGYTPADGAVGTAMDMNLAVYFSEVIQRGTGSIVLRTAAGATIETFDAASSTRLTLDGTTLHIDPTAVLSGNTHYVVAFDAGSIKDLSGNAYAGGALYDFTTASSGGVNLVGTAGADTLTGSAGADTISGLAGDDLLRGLGADDYLDGGAGLDVAGYAGTRSQYTALALAGGDIRISGPEGTDTLHAVERSLFTDMALGFDVDGIGGTAYRLYKAAFDRVPDAGGLGFWMHFLDSGFNLVAASDNFLNSDEFRAMYGTNPTNNEFVRLLYQHVMHRDPDQNGYDFWNAAMVNEGGAYGHAWTKGEVLSLFADSAENKALVVGVIQSGFEYVPFAG